MNTIKVFLSSRRRLIESYVGKSESVLRSTFTLGLCLLMLVGQSFASFEPLAVSARASGMGEAFTAVADDVYSTYYNPAGLVQLSRPELGTFYSRLYVGLSDNSEIARAFFGYGQPLGKQGRLGAIGLDYISLNLTGLYKEETFGLSYAYSIKDRWNVGGSVKLLKKTIGSDQFTGNAINSQTGLSLGQVDPLFANGNSKSAAAFDIGTQYKLTDNYALGAVVRNLNAPNMAIGNDSDPAPSYYALGLARKTRTSSVGVEMGEYNSIDTNYRFSVGGEKWLNAIGLRAGLAVGSRDYSVGSMGASYKFSGLQLDYAMNYPLQGVKGTLGNQQLSLTMRFGQPARDPVEVELQTERQKRLEAEMRAIEAQNDRDRMKSEIEKLTQPAPAAPAREEMPEEKKKSETDLEKALLEVKKAMGMDVPRTARERQQLQEYSTSVDHYIQTRRAGATSVERLDTIKDIQQRFKGTSLDMTAINQEAIALDTEVKKAKSDFDLSLGFYETLVRRGASVEERQRMLDRILMKYKPVGLDVSSLEKERLLIEKEKH